jgi:hypothetical protein
MHKRILLSFFVFSTLFVSAQTPGYMGKRVSLVYQNFIFPSLTPNSSRSSVNISHNAELNCVTGKRSSLCFTFLYAPIKVKNSINSHNPSSGTFSESDYLKFNSFAYALGLKLFFSRNKFAPLGGYVKWELEYSRGTLNVDDYSTQNPNYSGYFVPASRTTYSAHKMIIQGGGPAISFGKQRIFFDKLIVDYGVRAAIIVAWNTDGNINNSGYENSLETTASNVVLAQQFLNLRIGIGFLAF